MKPYSLLIWLIVVPLFAKTGKRAISGKFSYFYILLSLYIGLYLSITDILASYVYFYCIDFRLNYINSNNQKQKYGNFGANAESHQRNINIDNTLDGENCIDEHTKGSWRY